MSVILEKDNDADPKEEFDKLEKKLRQEISNKEEEIDQIQYTIQQK